MSGLQWLGAGLMSIPFVIVFVVGVRDIGFGITVAIFLGVLALAAVVTLGAFLMTGVLA